MAIIVAIAAISTASIFIRFAQREAPSIVIAAYRLGLATIVLAPIALWKYRAEISTLSKKQLGLVALSGAFLAFHFASWITSLEYTSVASSVVLVTTAPLWVAVFSPVFLNEKIGKAVAMGLVLALVGGIVVGLSNACSFGQHGLTCPSFAEFFDSQSSYGDLLALIGAMCSASYLMIGRSVRANLSLVPYTTLVYGTAAGILVVMALFTGEKFTGYSGDIYIWLIALALIPQIVGHSIFNWALKYLSAAYVSIALLGEPVGTVILAYFLLRESPTLLELAGGILILLGIYLASRAEFKK
jgi:drug/metabolite transporter (DMT)-like permease